MASAVAIITLGVLLLAVLAVFVYTQREDRKQIDSLLDRIQSPAEAKIAEINALPPLDAEPPPDLFDEPVEPSPGLLLDSLMEVR